MQGIVTQLSTTGKDRPRHNLKRTSPTKEIMALEDPQFGYILAIKRP